VGLFSGGLGIHGYLDFAGWMMRSLLVSVLAGFIIWCAAHYRGGRRGAIFLVRRVERALYFAREPSISAKGLCGDVVVGWHTAWVFVAVETVY